MATPTSSNTPSTTPSSAPTPPTTGGGDTQAQADQKREYRAEKKAEQQRRKEERKRIALETGIDPALLPEAIGGGVQNGKIAPKGFKPREWINVPQRDGQDGKEGSKKVSIMSWNVSYLAARKVTSLQRRESEEGFRLNMLDSRYRCSRKLSFVSGILFGPASCEPRTTKLTLPERLRSRAVPW
jgi:hypothetical protein